MQGWNPCYDRLRMKFQTNGFNTFSCQSSCFVRHNQCESSSMSSSNERVINEPVVFQSSPWDGILQFATALTSSSKAIVSVSFLSKIKPSPNHIVLTRTRAKERSHSRSGASFMPAPFLHDNPCSRSLPCAIMFYWSL